MNKTERKKLERLENWVFGPVDDAIDKLERLLLSLKSWRGKLREMFDDILGRVGESKTKKPRRN